ncbi:hypothetical protein EYF80_035827 [Liparis tanakae]|uniref:Uncharacterized protein n=1 Tax=Liparis tanakae TaxID=230148 RepID=A0A4Z2GKT2_9TELE|nr:hypothetical protein EYF80_035827 [Liparis tanakae]
MTFQPLVGIYTRKHSQRSRPVMRHFYISCDRIPRLATEGQPPRDDSPLDTAELLSLREIKAR